MHTIALPYRSVHFNETTNGKYVTLGHLLLLSKRADKYIPLNKRHFQHEKVKNTQYVTSSAFC